MIDNIFQTLAQMGHEQIVYCSDEPSGLKAIIAIHNTVLGPALGGTRLWQYASDTEALTDVLRLSRGMTYKNALAGLNLGGGKAVIIGDTRQMPSEAALRFFGRCVENLNGKYITAEDVGMSPKALEYVAMETDSVAGMPIERGGSGDPSPFTALGVYMGMKAAAKKVFGSDSLAGKRIAVQGVGNVGKHLLEYLKKENAKLFITDYYPDKAQAIAQAFGAEIVGKDEIYDLEMDIYSPCALGATLNDETLKRLKTPIVAGAANNQLQDEKRHGDLCLQKNMTYVPDFLINAGGVINIATEVQGSYNPKWATSQVEALYGTILNVLQTAEQQKRNAQEIAIELASKRIQDIARIKAIY